jgi:hypothetical protein
MRVQHAAARLPHRLLAERGYEVWSVYDEGAEVFELFASEDCNDYVGCATSRQEAMKAAREWIAERADEFDNTEPDEDLSNEFPHGEFPIAGHNYFPR